MPMTNVEKEKQQNVKKRRKKKCLERVGKKYPKMGANTAKDIQWGQEPNLVTPSPLHPLVTLSVWNRAWSTGQAAKAIDLLHFVCQKLIELMTSAIDLCGTQMSVDKRMDG